MKKYYLEIDKLRGIAILMVILYHGIIVYPVNLHEIFWCKLLHDFLWYMEMPLFFIVSGFCCVYEKGHFREYLKKKASRLLIPHFTFGIIEILPRVFPNSLVREQMEPWEAVRELILYGGGDWFLWTLFLLFLTVPIMQWLYHKGIAWKVVLVISTILLYGYSYRMTNLFLIQMWAWFFLYFFAGWLLRQVDYEHVKSTILQKKRTALLGFLLMTGVFWQNSMRGENRLLTVLGTLGGALFFWFLADQCRKTVHSFLLLCGRYSLQMYLLGSYALVASRTLLVMILGVTNPIPVIILNFILDVAITILISRYLFERFKPFRILSGMK